MRQIVDTAKRYNNFVRMDMEDLGHCQATLDLLHELRQMYDKEQDVKNLKGVSLRLVKGTYKEPPEVAFQDKQQVDENYMNIIRLHLLNGSYTAIATHETDMQQQLVKEGYTMRVYVPFGNDWFGYFMSRLA
ncbi:proline dehydrogenase [Anoxybacillus pushchinoensis]|uniref:Proline dehydrogenase n=1 Tax=Anoxybacillus pushchinoensis TaxID=150248 RepID=A0A1I0SEF1_9BACL|nr:proline dehydrogenase [Anoxybacillus pushchinoensis]